MLRGNIDQVTRGQISGWVYSDVSKVAGRKLLAFVGERCIGSGEVGLLRPDLKEAGLGDGKLGFEIFIDGGDIKDLNLVNLRLEFSDFALFPQAFHKSAASASFNIQELFSAEELERVEWMNRQGWLTNEQYFGLKALNTLGMYQRTYSKAELNAEPMGSRASNLYADLLSTVYRRDISKEQLEIEPAKSYIAGNASVEKYLDVIALFGDAFEFNAIEGAQSQGAKEGTEPVTLRNAAHQVVVIHRECLAALNLDGKSAVQLIHVKR